MCAHSISKIYFVFLPGPYYYSILFFSLLKIGTQFYIFTFFVSLMILLDINKWGKLH